MLSTNFRDMYLHLRSNGYYVEVLGQPYSCFDAKQYGTLLIIDPEEEFYLEEIEKLHQDYEKGLSIIIFADWYNVSVMQKVKFFDENTRQWWLPVTGGANIPALNDLLERWHLMLGDQVYEGYFKIDNHEMYYASGTSIVKYPAKNFALLYRDLNDQAEEILKSKKILVKKVPILGLYSSKFSETEFKFENFTKSQSGQLAVFGDSSCLDTSHMQRDCYWMLDALLQFTTTGKIPSFLSKTDTVVSDSANKVQSSIKEYISSQYSLTTTPFSKPKRMEGSLLYKYSKVIDSHSKVKSIPTCTEIHFEVPELLNTTVSVLVFKSPKLLSLANSDSKLLDAPFLPSFFVNNDLVDESLNGGVEDEHFDGKSNLNQVLKAKQTNDVSLSLYIFIMFTIILLLAMFLIKQRIFIHKGHKRRSQSSLKRPLRIRP